MPDLTAQEKRRLKTMSINTDLRKEDAENISRLALIVIGLADRVKGLETKLDDLSCRKV